MRQVCANPKRGERSAHIMHQTNAPKAASDHFSVSAAIRTVIQCITLLLLVSSPAVVPHTCKPPSPNVAKS